MYVDAWCKSQAGKILSPLAWCKSQAGKILSPLEGQIAAIVQQHPEYHEALQPDGTEKDYVPEGGQSNPFLHMGLHLAVREQVATDRPAGVCSPEPEPQDG